MKSRWFLWLVAVLIGSALALPLRISAAEKEEKKAAQPGAPAKMEEKKAPEKKPEVKAKSATGELVSVDAKAGMLAVKVKNKEMSFTAETKAAKQSLEKVKVGESVTVSYTEKEGKMVASSIKAAKAKKAEKKEGMMEEKGKMEEKKK